MRRKICITCSWLFTSSKVFGLLLSVRFNFWRLYPHQ